MVPEMAQEDDSDARCGMRRQIREDDKNKKTRDRVMRRVIGYEAWDWCYRTRDLGKRDEEIAG